MKTNMLRAVALSLTVTVGMLALPGASHSAESAPAAAKMCQGCHGKDGVSKKDTVPTIAGMSAGVHADYLYAYRDGARTCDDPGSKAMCSMPKKLSDEQIEAIAEHFAVLEFKAAAQDFDTDKAALGAEIHAENCAKCHTDGGSNPDDEASILAGQWMPYLQKSMAQFVGGEREQPEAMKRKTEGLSAADVEALAHYYASQQ